MDKQAQLNQLKEAIKQANLPLKETATNLVFGKGNPNASILFIGESPGKKEDEQGLPFVGTSGKLLDQFLQNIGLNVDDCYIANILKYRPPNNRDPNREEIKAHTPYLVRQIEIIKPHVIVTLGNYATKFILSSCNAEKMNDIAGITQVHGKIKKITLNTNTYKVIPTFHPAALIYNRKLRPSAEQDFITIKKEISQKNLFSF
jgi:uracil-DNA glycosylase